MATRPRRRPVQALAGAARRYAAGGGTWPSPGSVRWCRSSAARDAAAVASALVDAGITHLAGRAYAAHSGGERQRALAQLSGAERPAALLLDEPTASLDVRRRAALLQGVHGLANGGTAVPMMLHDLNETAFIADRVALLADGRLRARAVLGRAAAAHVRRGLWPARPRRAGGWRAARPGAGCGRGSYHRFGRESPRLTARGAP